MHDVSNFLFLRNELREAIISVTPSTFEAVGLKLFRFQALYNSMYRKYLRCLGSNPDNITSLTEVPFLPISFFKRHAVITGDRFEPQQVFESSGTTGDETSRHYVRDLSLYEKMSVRNFQAQYGSLTNYHILALLPSYLERGNSSLVYMVRHFMRISGSTMSGFYLDDFDSLNKKISEIASLADGRKILLIGVTFALLDWAERQTLASENLFDKTQCVVMETGGMKGRRKELLREEVHAILKNRLGVNEVHSEYGMTELLSQAYSTGRGIFSVSETLQLQIREVTDPFTSCADGQTGGVNLIDLGNLDSCAFIASSDLGRYDRSSGTFEILGRLDNSDIRGCNLLYG